MNLDAIPIGNNPPEDINVVIEVPIGASRSSTNWTRPRAPCSSNRFLHTPMRYPGNYGCVPHTLSGDGDPIDVLVANPRQLFPRSYLNVRPIGVLKMEDKNGIDEKIIAVPVTRLTQRYGHVAEYTDLPAITIEQIQHFFEHYKDLEPAKWAKLVGWATVPRRF